MTSPEPDFDSLVEALRSDLPSPRVERRVRRRLLAAGIAVTTGVIAPGASATGLAGASSSSALLLQKLGALSWTVKVGLAGIAATVALPAAVYLTSARPSSPTLEGGAGEPHASARSVRPVPAASAVSIAAPSMPIEAIPPSPDSSHAVAPRPAGRAPAALSTDEGAARRSTLGEETVLVERALYALRRGDRDGARRTLEEHARRFPNGLLARERDRALERANTP